MNDSFSGLFILDNQKKRILARFTKLITSNMWLGGLIAKVEKIINLARALVMEKHPVQPLNQHIFSSENCPKYYRVRGE